MNHGIAVATGHGTGVLITHDHQNIGRLLITHTRSFNYKPSRLSDNYWLAFSIKINNNLRFLSNVLNHFSHDHVLTKSKVKVPLTTISRLKNSDNSLVIYRHTIEVSIAAGSYNKNLWMTQWKSDVTWVYWCTPTPLYKGVSQHIQQYRRTFAFLPAETTFGDPLSVVLRRGTQQLLMLAIENEVASCVNQRANLLNDQGNRQFVCNSYTPVRINLQTNQIIARNNYRTRS